MRPRLREQRLQLLQKPNLLICRTRRQLDSAQTNMALRSSSLHP
jgi:hypothetical protein